MSGYARTIEALEFLNVVNGHTQDSIPIDVVADVTGPPAPFRTHADAMNEIVALLDQAKVDLLAGGAAFSFTLPNGFSGFNTPPTFLKFNRALRARVAVYLDDFAGALTALSESFLDVAAPMSLGVYIDHGTGPGDFANPLAQNPQVGENFAHPSLETDAQLQPSGAKDQRFLDKVVTRPERSVGSGAGQLSSHLGWIRYATPSTAIPIIRNEELILLRAEANIGLSNLLPATDDINVVRTVSGKLASIPVLATPTAALDELLYNKRYSLLYEGGHRWIDARHYNRLGSLPIDRPANNPPDVVPRPCRFPRPRCYRGNDRLGSGLMEDRTMIGTRYLGLLAALVPLMAGCGGKGRKVRRYLEARPLRRGRSPHEAGLEWRR